jgi:hypothetical protein
MASENDDDLKNTLPGETDDAPDSGMPRQLRTQADDEDALSADEAAVGGITQPVYGDDSTNPNEDDQRDALK